MWPPILPHQSPMRATMFAHSMGAQVPFWIRLMNHRPHDRIAWPPARSNCSRPRREKHMELFNEERSAQVVGASFANTPDPRLRSLLTTLAEHLHAFIKEVQLTEDEWATAVDFLTRTGQKCDAVRQEFVL